jgi:hypothetical protein
MFSNSLPYQCRNADLYKTYKVVINEPKPYLRNNHYVNNYKQYKYQHSKQDVIRNSNDSRYTNRKEHPNHMQNIAITLQHKNTHPEAKSNSSKKKGNKQGRR